MFITYMSINTKQNNTPSHADTKPIRGKGSWRKCKLFGNLLDPKEDAHSNLKRVTTLESLLNAYFHNYNCELRTTVFFSFGFSCQGSPRRVFHLHLVLSSAPPSVTLVASINLLVCLPGFLFPCSSSAAYFS